MRNILIYLSGADRRVIALCPSERGRFGALGATVLLTGVASFMLSASALNAAIDVGPGLALVVGLVWAGLILTLDRWLIAAASTGGRRLVLAAMPRILLGLLLGLVLSTALAVQVFRPEITAQVAFIRSQNAAEFARQLFSGPTAAQIARQTEAVDVYRKVIDSGGSAALTPATDTTFRTLTQNRENALAWQRRYYTQWQCQLYGGPGCPATGNGPLAESAHLEYLSATSEVAALTSSINRRLNTLKSPSAAARNARLQLARQNLPGTRAQLAADQAKQDALQRAFEAANQGDGLLIRLQALNRLAGKNATIATARVLLFILIALTECLPVVARLMQKPGIYEKILQAEQEQELRDARHRSRAILQTRLERAWDRESAGLTRSAGSPATSSDKDVVDHALRRMQDMRPAALAGDPVTVRQAAG